MINSDAKAIFRRRILPVITALPLLFGTSCAHQADANETAVPELLEPVGVKEDTAPVRRMTVSDIDVYSGYVRPAAAEIHFERDGVLAETTVSIGTWVEAGTVVAELEHQDLENELAKVRAELAEQALSQAEETELGELELADLRDRREVLLGSAETHVDSPRGPITREAALQLAEIEIEDQEARISRLQAEQDQARKALEDRAAALETELDASFLKAPADGRVLLFSETQPGLTIRAEDGFAEIIDENEIYIESEFISNYDLENAWGTRVRINGEEFETEATLFDYRTAADLTQDKEDMRTRFDFAGGVPEEVRIGDLAQVIVEKFRLEDQLAIPINAVYRGAGTAYVYVAKEEGPRERRDVKVRLVTEAWAVIEEGVEEGDVVYVQDN